MRLKSGNSLPTGITFADLGVALLGDSDLFVDNVSIVVVPEPALLGLAAMSTTGGIAAAPSLMTYRSRRHLTTNQHLIYSYVGDMPWT